MEPTRRHDATTSGRPSYRNGRRESGMKSTGVGKTQHTYRHIKSLGFKATKASLRRRR